jgi:hypothetical protein
MLVKVIDLCACTLEPFLMSKNPNPNEKSSIDKRKENIIKYIFEQNQQGMTILRHE